MRRIDGRGGFTLIELVVVIAIIAVLAAVVTPAVVSQIKNARDSRRMADIKELNGAFVKFGTQNGFAPGDGIDPSCNECYNGKISSSSNLNSQLSGFFSGGMPVDPLGNTSKFFYYYDARHCNIDNCGGSPIQATVHAMTMEFPNNSNSNKFTGICGGEGGLPLSGSCGGANFPGYVLVPWNE